jgi:hypothetical protein
MPPGTMGNEWPAGMGLRTKILSALILQLLEADVVAGTSPLTRASGIKRVVLAG